jgi:predicted DNA-binding transcriptional regulator AlpA
MSDTARPALRGELITLKEAARRLGISPSWIYSHRAAGDLPFDFLQPVPGRILFDSADVNDYLAACRKRAENGEKRG